MSDSDSEINYCTYGTALDPYDEDEIPSKKPISIEDQVATDAQGRRRFHGAFTGGFSAGFCNTVGSLEGWVPSNFKSSRSEKSDKYQQKPEDFMDDEDIAEFGFAPQGLRPTDDYNSIERPRKRKFRPPDGPIPGQPVLQLLLEPVKETIGVKLLKQMGWKPGQGVGPRLTKAEKKKARKRIFGCEMPPGFERKTYSSDSEDNSDDDEITFAPDDYTPYICHPKVNTAGMGYVGLNRTSVLSGFSSKEPSHFTVVDGNNKKLSIQGQAFGVGALEDDDEDIYSREDMSRYDFSLGDSSSKSKALSIENSNILNNFVKSTQQFMKKYFLLPTIPKNFVPKHGARISRFEPLSEEKQRELDRLSKSRHNLNAKERSIIIEDKPITPKTKPTKEIEKSEPKLSIENSMQDVPKENSTVTSFKPFATNPDKQERFEKFVELAKKDEKIKLTDIQPISMTEWDRNQEKIEFEQALKMYQPPIVTLSRSTDFLVFDRFVSAQLEDDFSNPLAKVDSLNLHGSADMREAAKQKMFGKLTREISPWHPCSLLCKRFNVPEPFVETNTTVQKGKKRTVSVFDYLQASTANKVPVNNTTPSIREQKNALNTENTKKDVVNVKDVINSKPIVTETNLAVSISNKNTEIPKISNQIPDKPSVKDTSISQVDESNSSKNSESTRTESPDTKIADVWQKPNTMSKNETKLEIVLNTEEKIDLYKAIFLDSESEDENNEQAITIESKKVETPEETESKLNTFKKDIIADINKQTDAANTSKNLDIHIPTFAVATVKPASGIFKNIDLQSINENISKSISKTTVEQKNIMTTESSDDNNTYGPKLPTKSKISTSKNINVERNINILVKNSEVGADKWIEKSGNSQKKNKKSKKSKHKSRDRKSHHKKHKKSSKHKKKKYSDDSSSSSSSS